MKDYYKILGVREKASEEEIRARWAKLMRELHPDRVGDEGSNEERIREVNEAYEILKHPSNRVKYDLKRAYDRRRRRARILRFALPSGLVIVPVMLGSVYLYLKMPKVASLSKQVTESRTNQTDQTNEKSQKDLSREMGSLSHSDQTNQINEKNQTDQINQRRHKTSKKVDKVIPQEKVEIVAAPAAPPSALPHAVERKLRSKEKQPEQTVSKSETPIEIAKLVPNESKKETSKKVKKVVPQEDTKVVPTLIEPKPIYPRKAEKELRSDGGETAQAASKSEAPVEIGKVPPKEVSKQASIPPPSMPGEELKSRERPSTQTIPKSEIPVPTEKVVPKETNKVTPQEATKTVLQTNQIRPEGSASATVRSGGPTDAATQKRMDAVDTKDAMDSKTQLAQQRIGTTDAKAQSPQLIQRSDGPGERISARSSIAEEGEIRQFFARYVERYIQKDLDGFLSFFSSKATQNEKEGFDEIRKIYENFFNQTQHLQYRLGDLKIKIRQNAVEATASYEVDQTLKKRGEKKVWRGPIRWTLVREQGALKIISIVYLHQKDS